LRATLAAVRAARSYCDCTSLRKHRTRDFPFGNRTLRQSQKVSGGGVTTRSIRFSSVLGKVTWCAATTATVIEDAPAGVQLVTCLPLLLVQPLHLHFYKVNSKARGNIALNRYVRIEMRIVNSLPNPLW
jgi:hypothetical protein